MPTPSRTLSTAEVRRDAVADSAVRVFATSGFSTTTIAAVAADAGISPAYVSKLFPNKVALFVHAIDRCYDRIIAALENASTTSETMKPADVLHHLGGAYADLIADRDLLMLQVHAQAATNIPEVRDAVRSGIGRVTSLVASVSRAEPADVQRFVAFGQLCHLLTTVDAFDLKDAWAVLLTDGVRHSRPKRRRR